LNIFIELYNYQINNNMQTIDNFNFAGKKAFVRVDFNVPLDENFVITDDNRIRAALPTLKKILGDGGSLIIASHMGRPKKNPDAAYALIEAQKALKRLYPSYSLIIYDAARPMSVQKKMWNVVEGTSKYKYVSNPNRGGGLHNYGLAVDISIQDSLGQPLPMGTKVDHLGMEAHITDEIGLVHNGKMSETERQNRLLLRKVMKETGFRALPSEWWHFNFCSRDVAKQKYKLIP
jgi:D-alanyl-D-alanine dipeptidase